MPVAESRQAGHAGLPQGAQRRARTEREVAGAHGVFNMSATDHFGLDERARDAGARAGRRVKMLSPNGESGR